MRRLMERLGLTVNERKTRIACVPEESFDFLGYTVGRFYGKDGQPFVGTEPSRKATARCLNFSPYRATSSPQCPARLPSYRGGN